jgi:protein required for attachment to host cells
MVKSRNQRSEEELQLFLRRVAASADRALAEQACRSAAIIAPPHVLNVLRDLMDDKTRRKLASEMCADLVDADPAAVDSTACSANL